MERNELRWIEIFFNKIPLPYPVVCFIIGFLIYFIYLYFSSMIYILPLNFYAKLSAVSMSILIPFMIGGIQYLVNVSEKITSDVCILLGEKEDICNNKIKKRIISSKWFYIFIFLVIAPFYMVDWISPLDKSPSEHFIEMYFPIYSIDKYHNSWGLAFDAYLQVLGFFSLLLLSYILWILINIIMILKYLGKNCCIIRLESSIFNIRMKIVSIKSFIFNILLIYFLVVSLSIISYLNPTKFFSKETGILLILLLIGISFFFLGISTIQKVLKWQIELELDDINKKIQENIKKLKNIVSMEEYSEKDKVSRISDVIDIFRKQREDIEKMNTNMYDILSIIRFIEMLILPFISSIFKIAVNDTMVSTIFKEKLVSKINDIVIIIFK